MYVVYCIEFTLVGLYLKIIILFVFSVYFNMCDITSRLSHAVSVHWFFDNINWLLYYSLYVRTIIYSCEVH